MSDIIQLLPDHIANQIAAGEVVQRPASVVKEMLENAIDAGATKIELVIKDAGRTLIQVIDNGAGMSATDARMSFERHATSKLRKAEDLFAICTMGFRGEALASIAAVAHVELKTKPHDAELGTQIIIEGSEIKDQSPCACSSGTSIAVKNLFFNIPARRNFLKSDNVEFTHVLEEFNRIALIHPEVAFTVYNNGKQTILLPPSGYKLRIIALFGNSFQSKLVAVEENTQNIHISGYIVTPDGARRTRGDQYFFVNKRYIKHPYLHHAVDKAFTELIPQGYFPGYFISLEVDPKTIDINIHPTKTEIKFADEKLMYGFLNSCIRKTLGVNSLTPTLDFNQEQYFNVDQMPKDYIPKAPTLNLNPNYNPFSNPNPTKPEYRGHDNRDLIQSDFNSDRSFSFSPDSESQILPSPTEISIQSSLDLSADNESNFDASIFQFNRTYIVTKLKTAILVIDQQAAHERILFERYLLRFENSTTIIQQTLFPQTLSYSASEAELIKEIKAELFRLGFDIQEFGNNTFIVNGTPADIEDGEIKNIIDGILENFKNNLISHRLDKDINVALSMAKSTSIKQGQSLTEIEMQNIIDELYACQVSDTSPTGKKITVAITEDQLKRLFNS
jgi:DNA mismatch repair protein MutL